LSFQEAKNYVKSLNLKSVSDWQKHCSSEDFPINIPKAPRIIYKDYWLGWGDFLGSGNVAPQNKKYRTYDESSKFIRSLGIKSISEWNKYCKSGNKPDDIPADIRKVYREEFKSVGEFLGTGRIADHLKKYKSFEDAKKFIRGLNIKSTAEWNTYCKSGLKPNDIPSDLNKVYKGQFKSISEFFGTNNIASKYRIYKSFNELKKLARALKIKSQSEWYLYWKQNPKPLDIPISPQVTYKNKGWQSWGDFLGSK